jgi:hypothetical protein
MSKGQFAAVAVIALAVAWGAWHVLGLILAALILFGAYWVSLIIHPRTRHTGWRSCNGTGEHRGAIFGWTHRRCARCDGGRMVRWGAGQFGSERARSEYATRREARRTARNNRAWR